MLRYSLYWVTDLRTGYMVQRGLVWRDNEIVAEEIVAER